MILAGELCFLDEPRRVGWPPEWSPPNTSRLWRYHLHYLEVLWVLDYAAARCLTEHWIAGHPLGGGREGWEPYPTSLRLINLCGVFFGRHRQATLADTAFRDRLWASLVLQSEWLLRHREVHLGANHLLENGVALAAAGACFAGAAATRWRRHGLAVLAGELPEQVLPDGGHFERSPAYQARVTWGLAFLHASRHPELVAAVEGPLVRSAAALTQLCHPDGEIALLNDSAFGMAAPARDVVAWARDLLPGAIAEPTSQRRFALAATGYYGAATAEGHYLVVDAAPIGPDHQPGHAHADIFSFELSLRGRRIVVDAGNHDYEPSPLRRYCRSTRAHSTVEVAGEDQCELWGVFRVGRRGHPRDVAFAADAEGFRLSGRHDGYSHLPGRPEHRRELRWLDRGLLLVRDTVTSGTPVAAVSRLHLHPETTLRRIGPASAAAGRGGVELRIAFAGEGRLVVEEGFYCPRFGTARPSPVLAFHGGGSLARSGFALACGAADLTVDLEEGARVDGQLHPF